MDRTTDMQALVDRATLTDLAYKLAYAEDDRDYESFRALYADKVYVDLSAHIGGEPAEVTADQLTERARQVLGSFTYTQHSVANVLVAIDGDRAVVRANVSAYHHLPMDPGVDDYCLVRNRWTLGFVRSEERWLIDRVVVVRDGPVQGHADLYQIAAARVAAAAGGKS